MGGSCVLTTLLLLQAGYACVPYSSLDSVVERSKQAYTVFAEDCGTQVRFRIWG